MQQDIYKFSSSEKIERKIYLILGNHDFKNYKPAWSDLFKMVRTRMLLMTPPGCITTMSSIEPER